MRSSTAIAPFPDLLRSWPSSRLALAGVASAAPSDSGRHEEAVQTWRDEYESRGEDEMVSALDCGYEGGAG